MLQNNIVVTWFCFKSNLLRKVIFVITLSSEPIVRVEIDKTSAVLRYYCSHLLSQRRKFAVFLTLR